MNDTAALLAGPALAEPQVWAARGAGVYPDMPADEYHAAERLSASGAKKLLRSPLHYRVERDAPSEPTAAMVFGTAVHCGVLEPDEFARRYVLAPYFNKRTNDGKRAFAEWLAANAGRTGLDADEWERARRAIAAVLDHPAASRLLEGARCEGSAFWEDGEYHVPCKMRWDAQNHGGLIDLKTCADASPDGFARQAANFLYHVQGAHYVSGAEHALNETPAFFAIIAVESEPPHAVACYTLPPVALQAGRRLMDEAMARYARALELGRWEGYPQTINPLDLPRWALRDEYR
jgi:hypothetical protein